MRGYYGYKVIMEDIISIGREFKLAVELCYEKFSY